MDAKRLLPHYEQVGRKVIWAGRVDGGLLDQGGG